mmetsp:Transcript_19398/g.58414  ORF Transcript_19398/g.58414 Transcript_19398/m.58414 type:complete len:179 (-) Transcript_19398:100-636(-)
MGQGLDVLQTCSSVHPDEKAMRVDEARSSSHRGDPALHFLAACGGIGLAEAEIRTRKKGVHRPLLKQSQRRLHSHAGESGVTALMTAAQFGSAQSVKRLLSEGANVNAADARGYTALHWAAQEGHPEACQALLLARADVHVKNVDGQTALQLAASEDPAVAAQLSAFMLEQKTPGEAV